MNANGFSSCGNVIVDENLNERDIKSASRSGSYDESIISNDLSDLFDAGKRLPSFYLKPQAADDSNTDTNQVYISLNYELPNCNP
jgi:hypothetical protein